MSKTKKPKIQAKFFPFAVRQPLWDMAKKYGKQKYTIVAIWDYMWWRSGKGGLFELAEDIVCWDLDCDPTTLRAVRKILIAEGWLKKDTLRDKGGKWMTRGFTVIAKGATVPKSLDGEDQPPSHEPAVVVPTVEGTSDGGTPHTVLVHELYADASTSSSTPSASTSTASSFSPSVSLGTGVPVAVEPEEKATPEGLSLSSEDKTQINTLMHEVGGNQTIPMLLGLPYFTNEHESLLRRIATVLYFRNRSVDWLSSVVGWAKNSPKDREAIFWKRKLQTGNKAVAKLAEFLEKGTIAEQYDVTLYNAHGADIFDPTNRNFCMLHRYIEQPKTEPDFDKPIYVNNYDTKNGFLGYERKVQPEPGSVEEIMANNQAKAAKASVASDIKAILAGFDPEEA